MLLDKKFFKNFGVIQIAKRHNLLGKTKLLIRSLSALLVLRLLDKHALLVASLDLVFEVVAIVLSGDRIVSFLDGV